jgi:hypothetical protein
MNLIALRISLHGADREIRNEGEKDGFLNYVNFSNQAATEQLCELFCPPDLLFLLNFNLRKGHLSLF